MNLNEWSVLALTSGRVYIRSCHYHKINFWIKKLSENKPPSLLMSFSSNELLYGIRTDNRESRDSYKNRRHKRSHRSPLWKKLFRRMQQTTWIRVRYFFTTQIYLWTFFVPYRVLTLAKKACQPRNPQWPYYFKREKPADASCSFNLTSTYTSKPETKSQNPATSLISSKRKIYDFKEEFLN